MLRKTLCQVLSVTLFFVNVCYAEPKFHTIPPENVSREYNIISSDKDKTDNSIEGGFVATSRVTSSDATPIDGSAESSSITTNFISLMDKNISGFRAIPLNEFYQYIGNRDFLKVVKKCHDYIREHDFYYSKGVELPLDRDNNRRVDCSSFVSWCIYEYTNTAFYSHDSAWFLDTAISLKNGETFTDERKGWRVITDHDDYRPGDIMCYKGHVHVYAGRDEFGNNYAYNAGGNEAIADTISTLSDWYFNDSIYAIRIPKN